jgi:hypothetical protein
MSKRLERPAVRAFAYVIAVGLYACAALWLVAVIYGIFIGKASPPAMIFAFIVFVGGGGFLGSLVWPKRREAARE